MSRKIKKGKIVYITENQLNMISEAKIIENVVSKFSLDYRLVKLIMDYLNKGFKKGFKLSSGKIHNPFFSFQFVLRNGNLAQIKHFH